MNTATVHALGAPQRRHSPFVSDPTAFMVRTTDIEWEALTWAAEEYGEGIGQFAADAIKTWLDPKIEIPRIIYTPPITNKTKRLHLDKAIVTVLKNSGLADELGRKQPFNNSDIAMSAILSFVQGMMDNRPASQCRRFAPGASVIDKARPALEVKILP